MPRKDRLNLLLYLRVLFKVTQTTLYRFVT